MKRRSKTVRETVIRSWILPADLMKRLKHVAVDLDTTATALLIGALERELSRLEGVVPVSRSAHKGTRNAAVST